MNPRTRTRCYRCGKTKLHYTQKRSGRKRRQVTRPCVDCRSKLREKALSSTPEYKAWRNLLSRCRNKNDPAFARYGGRGITVCAEWKSFDVFLRSMKHRPSPAHSIDRIDNDAGYSKTNCRWATQQQQNRNRRDTRMLTFEGETKPLCDWADELGFKRMTLLRRKDRGWSDERTLMTPLDEAKSRKPTTHRDKKRMAKLRARDVSFREIARRLGVSASTVYHHVG